MGDAVAAAVVAQFAALPKTGKPQPHEHTVLAGIALSLPAAAPASSGGSSEAGIRDGGQPQHQQDQQRLHQQQAGAARSEEGQQGQLAVVALATGTKCLGGSRRRPGGVALSDCHAEALCRRALLRWLYSEMAAVVQRYQHATQQAVREQEQRKVGQQGAPAAAAPPAPPSGSPSADPGAPSGVDVAALAAAASTAVLRLLPPEAAGRACGGDGDGGDGASGIFGGWRFALQPRVQVHMYVSQPPCGDASILGPAPQGLSTAQQAQGGCAACGTATEAGAAAGGGTAGGAPVPGSFGRTGAKPLKRPRVEGVAGGAGGGASAPMEPTAQAAPSEAHAAEQQGQDRRQHGPPGAQQAHQPAVEHGWGLPQQQEVEPYAQAQATGVVRRKPGRGDATLSMSCSDKLARWCLLGLQGSLLSGVLAEPLHLSSITVSLQPAEVVASPAVSVPAASAGAATPSAAAAAPGSPGRELAAALQAALHRALLGRTVELVAERLPAGTSQAAPTLHVHLPSDGPGSGHAPGGAVSMQALQHLGLCPSAARKVGSGSSVVWVVPPSTAFKWKQPPPPLQQQQSQQLQQQQQQHQHQPCAPSASSPGEKAAAAAAAAAPPCAPATLVGGTLEAVAGSNGLKVGAAKPKPGQPVHPSAQPFVCKAALLAAWQQLATQMRQLAAPTVLHSAAGPAVAERAAAAAPAQPAKYGVEDPAVVVAVAGQTTAPAASAQPWTGLTYRGAKRAAAPRYAATWQRLLEPPSPLEGWIPKPAELEQFVLPAQLD